MEPACLAAPVTLAVPGDEAGAEAAVDAVATWREMAVTGVCADDDVAALAVLAGLREQGLTAQADLAVIGAVDSPAARLAAPPLTTVAVAVDMRDTARHLVAAVTSLLEGRPMPVGPEVTGVIERRSV
ncbi:substrate-binding domain-containing protein [Streptomyces sp. ID05-04B]|uniref:substrate-binding domain-containing protein n=1 Tax=unclassified Streptomyces TaxID=2593676 RepID=UPI0020B16D14|nr:MULTISPECIES: substrate-binding domain-containing protein [unclassified Streptomyces]MDX5567807.1 substrate-binding domain-containing protein [Streptomyces sp. ID05-04B]